jgi:hypothetical protein
VSLKTDESILKVLSAAVERHSTAYQTWQYTKLWNDLDNQVQTYLCSCCNLESKELPFLVVFVDEKTWTLISSRAVYYAKEGMKAQTVVKDIEEIQFGDFKGVLHPLTLMHIKLKDGVVHEAAYESGKASMGVIYALQTLRQIH